MTPGPRRWAVLAALGLAACGTSVTGEGPGITGDPPPSRPSGVVAPAILTSDLPVASLGQPYLATLVAGGGASPISWTVPGGGLPPGIALDNRTGILAGTPTAAGVYAFDVNLATGAGAVVKGLSMVVQ